ATSSLPTLVKFERTLVQLFGLGNEVDVRPPWLLHVLEHCGLSACRTSLSTQTVKQPLDTSGFSRDRRTATPMMPYRTDSGREVFQGPFSGGGRSPTRRAPRCHVPISPTQPARRER
ncbi:hypothetical protein, partial [Xanthomonas translucens]|uniref:hypothetical protein n=1 Tax=Xanthomonas campestris pv. translucens TaxID=343 RepID=UPI001E518FD9